MDPEEPIRIPIMGEFHVHTFAPRDIKAVGEAHAEEAFATGLKALRIVHGKGIGVQREIVRSVLSRSPLVAGFRNAPEQVGGWGATIVDLK